MKRTLPVIIILSIIVSILFTGCSQSKTISSAQNSSAVSSASSTGSASASATPKYMQKALKMTKQEWIDKLFNLDVCVMMNPDDPDLGGLTFSDPKEIPSDVLFTFFCYITATEWSTTTGENNGDFMKWYDEKEQKFHVPVSDVKKVLNKYFEDVNFNPEEVYAYNAKTDCIDNYWEGMGGPEYSNAELIKRERLSYDTLRITVRFYEFDDFSVRYTKAYTIKFTDDGYKYISIVKV